MPTPEPPVVPAASGPGPSGVIHDIGYRHFEGTRLTRAEITRVLYVDTLRGAFGLGRSTRSKIMPFVLIALATLPTVVIAVLASVVGFEELPIGYTGYLGVISILISLFVAGQAPGAVSRDLRFRTVSLYFSRPLGRTDYVRAKYAALATAVLVFVSVPLLALYAGALLAPLDFLDQTRGLLLGLLDGALVAVVVSGIALLVASLTPRRGLGVAAVIGLLVITGGVQGALQGLGEVNGNEALAGYSGLVDPFATVSGLLVGLTPLDPSPGMPEPPGLLGVLAYALVLVLLSAGSYAALVWRYSRVSVS